MSDINKTRFRELVETFVPQWKYVQGPFGGEYWSKTERFWDGYSSFVPMQDLVGEMDDYIKRLEEKVNDLQEAQEK